MKLRSFTQKSSRFAVALFVTACVLFIAACGERVRAEAEDASAYRYREARSGAPTTQSESVEAAVRQVLVRQQEAWNRGHLEGFMEGYWNSPELVFTSGGRVHRGYDALLSRYRTTYGMAAEMGRLGFSHLEVHPLGATAAWALGRWDLERGPERLGGVFTLVLQKVEREWKIVHDHTSADATQ